MGAVEEGKGQDEDCYADIIQVQRYCMKAMLASRRSKVTAGAWYAVSQQERLVHPSTC